jgi:hypothetical protein
MAPPRHDHEFVEAVQQLLGRPFLIAQRFPLGSTDLSLNRTLVKLFEK